MCIKVNADDFMTIHHELGHNYYQRAYNEQPFLYLNGANDGFHEAIGDFIALSITPEYLVQIGLLDAGKVPSADKDIGLLLRQAMDKVAFLPFGLLMDKWRWGVFGGAIPPDELQSAWNELRRSTRASCRRSSAARQRSIPAPSITSPATRPMRAISSPPFCSSSSTRPPAGRPAGKARCTAAPSTATRRSARSSNAMLAMGASKPWPDALEAFTGSARWMARR